MCIEKRPYTLYGRLATLHFRYLTCLLDRGHITFGLLCFAEITEFAKELHSEMEKVVLMDELPENWTYPLIQPKLIEKYLRVINFDNKRGN